MGCIAPQPSGASNAGSAERYPAVKSERQEKPCIPIKLRVHIPVPSLGLVMGTNGDSPRPGHAPTCQDTSQVEEANAQDAMHHLQGDSDHQLQEGIEPQLLQPARTQEGTYSGSDHAAVNVSLL